MSLPGIAVFAYNRSDLLSGMLQSLQACDGFSDLSVTVFVDGPRSASDVTAVDEVRALVAGLRFQNLRYEFSDVNRGLRQSIYQGVSKVCAELGSVIVLEDDLLLSPDALTYFRSALDHYRDDPSVWSVCGYLYDAPELRGGTRTLSLPFTHPWGWATWKRAWDRFDLDRRPSNADLSSRAFRSAFDHNGMYPFTNQLRQSIAGRVNSWYIHWNYTIFENGGRSIFPPQRVVDNLGIGTGTHGGRLNPHEILVKRPSLGTGRLSFGDAREVDYAAIDLLHRSREMRVQRFISRMGGIRRRIQGWAP